MATLGKARAVTSAIEWKVADVVHPLMGPIKYAVQASDIATPVGNGKIVSLAYVSCQKRTGEIAIELTNATAANPAGGLGPTDLPRLVCNSPAPRGGDALAKTDIAASWEISTLGDALARGLAPSALRRCVSIDVLENLALPPALRRESQRVAMEITPYARELDQVFMACGEASAFPLAERQPGVSLPAAQSRPAAKSAHPERLAPTPWRSAHTLPKGRTNVRERQSVASPVVTQLEPAAKILVQRASNGWWRAKPRAGAAFGGYIRQDRLVFD